MSNRCQWLNIEIHSTLQQQTDTTALVLIKKQNLMDKLYMSFNPLLLSSLRISQTVKFGLIFYFCVVVQRLFNKIPGLVKCESARLRT